MAQRMPHQLQGQRFRSIHPWVFWMGAALWSIGGLVALAFLSTGHTLPVAGGLILLIVLGWVIRHYVVSVRVTASGFEVRRLFGAETVAFEDVYQCYHNHSAFWVNDVLIVRHEGGRVGKFTIKAPQDVYQQLESVFSQEW